MKIVINRVCYRFLESWDNQNSDPGKGSKGFSKEYSFIGYNYPNQNFMEGMKTVKIEEKSFRFSRE